MSPAPTFEMDEDARGGKEGGQGEIAEGAEEGETRATPTESAAKAGKKSA